VKLDVFVTDAPRIALTPPVIPRDGSAILRLSGVGDASEINISVLLSLADVIRLRDQVTHYLAVGGSPTAATSRPRTQ